MYAGIAGSAVQRIEREIDICEEQTPDAGCVSDGFGVKIVRFFGGIRGDSNKKSYC